jgi:hypothetical protein
LAKGGARVGSGRKPKSLAEKLLIGSARGKDRRRASALSATPVEAFDAPDDLTAAEKLVWERLAPSAFKSKTLTKATEYQFVLLCRNVVLERELAVNPEMRGGANHRGILQRIDSQLTKFVLSPMGKPLIEDAPKVDDPFAAFDDEVLN